MRISDWSSDVCSSDLPGKHGVLLRHDGINRGAGGFMTFDINAGDIQIFWVGVTGNGWGVLTIDNFDSESEARACVPGAEYSVQPATRSEAHTSELPSLMRISYPAFRLKNTQPTRRQHDR